MKIVRRRSLGEGNSVRDEWLLAKRFPERDKVHSSTASDLVAAPWEGWKGLRPVKAKVL